MPRKHMLKALQTFVALWDQSFARCLERSVMGKNPGQKKPRLQPQMFMWFEAHHGSPGRQGFTADLRYL